MLALYKSPLESCFFKGGGATDYFLWRCFVFFVGKMICDRCVDRVPYSRSYRRLVGWGGGRTLRGGRRVQHVRRTRPCLVLSASAVFGDAPFPNTCGCSSKRARGAGRLPAPLPTHRALRRRVRMVNSDVTEWERRRGGICFALWPVLSLLCRPCNTYIPAHNGLATRQARSSYVHYSAATEKRVNRLSTETS